MDSPNKMEFSRVQSTLSEGLRPFGPIRHVDVLAHLLGIHPSYVLAHIPGADCLVKNAVIVSIDAEWDENRRQHITELGLSALRVDSARRQFFPTMLEVMGTMEVSHLRITENAHMVNRRRCAGHPEKFKFGPTGFVSKDQAADQLKRFLTRNDAHGNKCPIILIGHSVANDVEQLEKNLGVNIQQSCDILMTLDTQIMVREIAFEPWRMVGLRDTLGLFGVQEPFLHNAGNDAVYTLLAGHFLATDLGTGFGQNADFYQTQVDSLKRTLKDRSNISCGISTYCTRCESTEHLASACTEDCWCSRCAVFDRGQADTHNLKKCPLIACENPCELCGKSKKEKFWANANTHTTADCVFKPVY